MKEEHKNLHVTRLSDEQHARTCNYWYVVTSNASPHTAFTTRQGLDRWLNERGLKLDGDLPDSEWGTCRIAGTYRTSSHLHDAEGFSLIEGFKTRDMSNAEWVEAVITDDGDGVKTVHTLNPNVRWRLKFDYRESERLMR